MVQPNEIKQRAARLFGEFFGAVPLDSDKAAISAALSNIERMILAGDDDAAILQALANQFPDTALAGGAVPGTARTSVLPDPSRLGNGAGGGTRLEPIEGSGGALFGLYDDFGDLIETIPASRLGGGGGGGRTRFPEEQRLDELRIQQLEQELARNPNLTTIVNERTGELILLDTQTGAQQSLGQFGFPGVDPNERLRIEQQQFQQREGRLGREAQQQLELQRQQENRLLRGQALEGALATGQLGMQAQDRFREILSQPADFLARAFSQRGGTSPLGQVTQADLINQLRAELQRTIDQVNALGAGIAAPPAPFVPPPVIAPPAQPGTPAPAGPAPSAVPELVRNLVPPNAVPVPTQTRLRPPSGASTGDAAPTSAPRLTAPAEFPQELEDLMALGQGGALNFAAFGPSTGTIRNVDPAEVERLFPHNPLNFAAFGPDPAQQRTRENFAEGAMFAGPGGAVPMFAPNNPRLEGPAPRLSQSALQNARNNPGMIDQLLGLLGGATLRGGRALGLPFNEGGTTRESRLVVGDAKNKRTGVEELVLNPTNAPLAVIPVGNKKLPKGKRLQAGTVSNLGPEDFMGTGRPFQSGSLPGGGGYYANQNGTAGTFGNTTAEGLNQFLVTHGGLDPATAAQVSGFTPQGTTGTTVGDRLFPEINNPIPSVTQAELIAEARRLSPPAVSALFNNTAVPDLRFDFGLFTPQQLNQLTPGEAAALNTRLATEFNTSLEDVMHGVRQRFGATRSRPRGRLVV